MRGRRRQLARVGASSVALLLLACTPDGADDLAADATQEGRSLEPSFPAAPGDPAVATTAPGSVEVGTVPAGDLSAPPQPVEPTDQGTAPPPEAAPTLSASMTDPAGDATAGVVDRPPWADLVGAQLIRTPDLFELRIQLGGGAAPTTSGGADRTLNVASFYDVDGDGTLDFEVWANLADGGWSGSWFDNRAGTAAFDDDALVGITVQGPDLVLRFPLGHIGGAEAFRWSLATEYGSYAVLGTDLAATDAAPDGGSPATFPA